MGVIVDLVEKLVDRCLQLAGHRAERQREFFQRFVEPLYSDFERVHEDYLSTFRLVRQSLVDGTASLDNKFLFDRIYADSIFSDGLFRLALCAATRFALPAEV